MDTQEPAAPQHPVRLIIPAPERSSRLLALLTLLFLLPKMIILIPHLLILYVLGFVAFIVGVIAQVGVLVTGRYPRGMHDIVAGVLRWQVRVGAYIFGLRDEYPPFTFKD